MTIVRKFILYGQGVAGLRDSDVVLSSFPRSGSTWIRFILCNLISLLEWDGRQVNFELLNETMVAFGNSNLLSPWPVRSIPRIVKTHRAYSPLFRRNRSIGVIRDPRDVMVSYYHFRRDRLGLFQGTFPEFIRDRRHGLEGWFRHYSSWRDRWTLVLAYECLRRDVYSEVSKILHLLAAPCLEQGPHLEPVLLQAIERSDLAAVRKADRVEAVALPGREARFARNGRTGQWPAYFGPEDLAYFDGLCMAHGVDWPALEVALAGGDGHSGVGGDTAGKS